MKRRTLALLACTLLPACFTLEGLPPPSGGEERDDFHCADGRDNDYDGRIDCEDTDCLMRGFCGEQIPLVPHYLPENTPETCTDGIDNDEDGQFDCGDRECQGIMELCCNAETNNVTCSNRLDDDGNGFADCTDFSCRNNAFVGVCQSETACVKLDANGSLLGCTAEEEEQARVRQCRDLFDNDGDRRTDCNDEDCEEVCFPGCLPGCAGPENTVERCLDGADNEGDGYIDCEDRDCFNGTVSPATGVAAAECAARAENTEARCEDGRDNDENGYTDCEDRACAAFCGTGQPEVGAAACRDGVDNDGNGFVDCDDNSCRYSLELAVREACEATATSCADRRDNNDNGFTDCADFSCRFYQCDFNGTCAVDSDCPSGQSCFRSMGCLRITSPCLEGAYLDSDLSEIPGGCPMRDDDSPVLIEDQQAQVRAGCTDGVDNDLDGFADCEDWDCNHNPLAVHAPGSPLEGLPLCRYTTGRTCVIGRSAGNSCVSDADCDGISGSCAARGLEGSPFVCQ